MQTWFIRLFIEVPIVTNYVRRSRWQKKFGSDVTIVPIYNDGHHLLLGTLQGDALTHYDPRERWQWVFFRDFCEAKYILANKHFLSEKATKPDMIGIQHLGHDGEGTARILTMSSPRNSVPYQVRIHLHCISFLAVRTGIIIGRLTVHQPLPRQIHSFNDRLLWVRKYTYTLKQIKRSLYW